MLKVILIDDEIVILQGLKKLIDWSKLELEIVGEAMDGLEGLSLIEEVRPDIVISDITMPNLNGIEMLKQTMNPEDEIVFYEYENSKKEEEGEKRIDLSK